MGLASALSDWKASEAQATELGKNVLRVQKFPL